MMRHGFSPARGNVSYHHLDVAGHAVACLTLVRERRDLIETCRKYDARTQDNNTYICCTGSELACGTNRMRLGQLFHYEVETGVSCWGDGAAVSIYPVLRLPDKS